MSTMRTTGFMVLAALLSASVVSAQQAIPAPSEAPRQGGMPSQGMMQGGGMMPMMGMMQMMDSCNRMMQTMMGGQGTPRPDGQQPAPQAPQGNRG